jgi:2',3'-cyclic-nucleotide 2'-phosphodiesterase (5'-nucleotidase family)
MSFSAEKLAEAQDLLNLNFFVPGELDFALGEDYLVKISKEHKFKFLIANLSPQSKISHTKWTSFSIGNRNLYLIGIVNPYIFYDLKKNIFTDPEKALKDTLNEINKDQKKNKTIILLSHGGMDFDKRIAKNFSNINWIIGSHSQAFLREPEIENKTKIVQVLSRNHYLGQLTIPLNPQKDITYQQIEVRENLEKDYPENPFTAWLQKYKTELDKIQASEQKSVGSSEAQNHLKANTYMDCMNCHMPQVESWQKTSHAIAFQTLIANQASNNPSCIKCHSLMFNDKRGFSGKDDIIQDQSLTPSSAGKILERTYWSL